MEPVKVSLGQASYEVRFHEGLNRLTELAGGNAFVVTDSNVDALYGARIRAVLGNAPTFVFPGGEGSKTLATVERAAGAMLDAGCNRRTLVVAWGGGVVGDLAGFLAGIYMRGTDYVQVPTTLLAQVDSSVGGKTGVDYRNVKNILGVFKQPKAVFVEPDFLDTLPAREIRCGWGEIIKTSFLDEAVDNLIESCAPLEEVVHACVRFKAGVVERDECEAGLRKILNFGHTVGHALETLALGEGGAASAPSDFCGSAPDASAPLSHGEYVLSGMWYEFDLAARLGMVERNYLLKSRERILQAAGSVVPVRDPEALVRVMASDKKNDARGISFLLPCAPRRVQEVWLSAAEVRAFLGGYQ